ncbi:ABC transporter permease [Paludibaculum fermentans]|uniref:ABC transporter permease n=1 Tax=Paludibaculum fermentans TaxID=1473598 RepID=UPI003EBC2F51
MISTNWFMRLFRRRSIEAEMQEELEFHREARIAHLVAQGITQAEAERRARLEFGAAGHYQEECRAALGYRLLDELRSDVRYAIRGLRKSPGFFAASITILALAIGANSVLFTLFNSFVVKPLPVAGAARHFDLNARNAEARRISSWTVPEMRLLASGASNQIEALYSYSTFQVLMLKPVQRQVLVSTVSADYFQVLGGRARLGRTFGINEDRLPLVVLSDSGWRKLFAADPNVIGQTLRIRATAYTIAGVMAPEFTGTEPVVPEFWTPTGSFLLLRPREPGSPEPRFLISGFLRPGISLAQVQSALLSVASHLDRRDEERIAAVEIEPRPSLFARNEEVSAACGLVFAAFLIVLLIACANLTNLHLARAAARTQEIAMRLSLGASRWRIIRQLLTESACIGILGALAAIALAAIGIRQVQDYLFSSMMGIGITLLPVTMDWRVFVYTAVLGIVAGITFGLLPALESTAPSLTASTKREGRMRPRRLRGLLIGGQIAASLVLLILAGVLIRNIRQLDSVATGYDLDHVLDLKVDQLSPGLVDRLSQLESVAAISAVSRVPLYGRLDLHAARLDGKATSVAFNQVDHRYFETLAVPLLEGRGFTRNEAETRARVTVISTATARKLWPDSPTAIGKSLELTAEPGEDSTTAGHYEVVGVVPNVVSGWMFEGADPTAVYLPASAGARGVSSIMVRVNDNPVAAAAALRTACAESVQTPVGCEPASLRQVASLQRFPFQAAAAVAGVLGLLALLLTGVGLYGVVNYAVMQRRKEFGIHVALGASPRQVMTRTISEAGRFIAGGLLAGLPLCLILSKLAASSVLAIKTFDPWAYTAVPCMLMLISLLACLGPARRAAQLDPMKSLRED